VINRGFGGSHLSDSVAFTDRIVIPYKPRLVLIYAGDNDIASGKSPQEVFDDFKRFVQKIHQALPDARVGFISIKPSPSREKFLESIKQANWLVKEYAQGKGNVAFIDVFTPMLNSESKPRAELFLKDMLHPNEKCYQLWASIITPVLEANR
jgi:lysophospholipase L1-like esterase